MITVPGQINVDFADVKAIMQNAGSALMGIGKAAGDNRAVEAAKQAIASPLLEISIDGAKGILFTVAGSADVSMYEVQEAAKVITGAADDDAKVIFGLILDESMGDEIRITVVATGFDSRDHRRAPSLGGEVELQSRSWKPSAVPTRPLEVVARATNNIPTTPGTDFPFSKRPVNQPSPVTARDNRDSNEDQQQQQRAQAPALVANNQAPKEDDSEIGIPAFIRRKMI